MGRVEVGRVNMGWWMWESDMGENFGDIEVGRVNMDRVDVGVPGARALRLQEYPCDLLVPRLPRRGF